MYGDAGIGLVAGAVILLVALRFAEKLDRETWCCVAVSVMMMAVGDALWARNGVLFHVAGVGVSLAELLYAVAYAIFAIALFRYAFKSRAHVDVAWVAVETLVTTALIGATLWVTFLAPTTRAIGGIDSAISADLSYVFFDFPLLFAPVLAVLLVMIRLGDQRLAYPWFAVAAGVLILIAAEVGWFWERAHGGVYPGSLAGFGFMAANMLLLAGAMTALEMQPIAAVVTVEGD